MPTTTDTPRSSTSTSAGSVGNIDLNCNNNGSNLLTNLPSVLKERIVRYLKPSEARYISQTCQQFYSDLQLSMLSPSYELLFSHVWMGETMTGDLPCYSNIEIPILTYRLPHSITLQCQWKDQGYGDRKGRLYIIAEKEEKEEQQPTRTTNGNRSGNQEVEPPFNGGRLVYESPFAPHTFSLLKVTFVPKPNETYHLWYRCGGGGGHLLMVEELIVNTLFFDDYYRNWTAHYRTLISLGILLNDDSAVEEEDDDEDEDEEESSSSTDIKKDAVFFTKLLFHVAESLLLYRRKESESEPESEPLGGNNNNDNNDTQRQRGEEFSSSSSSYYSSSPLSDFMESCGFTITPSSLDAIKEICHFLLQHINPPPISSSSLIIEDDDEASPPPPPPPLLHHHDHHHQNTNNDDGLPHLLKNLIIPFLNIADLVHLSLTNKNMHSILSISTIYPPLNLPLRFGSWMSDFNTTGDILSSSSSNNKIRIPVIPGRTHSIRISCQWKDLGLEESTTTSNGRRLVILAKPVNQKNDSSLLGRSSSSSSSSSSFRIAVKSPYCAPSDMSDLEMTLILPRGENEIYYLCQNIDDDNDDNYEGMHHLNNTIHVENIKVQLTIFDNGDYPRKTFTDTFRIVDTNANFNDLPPSGGGVGDDQTFFANLLLTTAQYLRRYRACQSRGGGGGGEEDHDLTTTTTLQDPTKNLLDFFRSCGFDLQRDGSLLALEELVKLLVRYNNSKKKKSNHLGGTDQDQEATTTTTHDNLGGIRSFNAM